MAERKYLEENERVQRALKVISKHRNELKDKDVTGVVLWFEKNSTLYVRQCDSLTPADIIAVTHAFESARFSGWI